MNIAIYTLTSELHDEQAVQAVTRRFLDSLGIDYDMRRADYADYGTHALDLIYVRTGGTEGIFRRLLPELQRRSPRPFYLLTSGQSNSLAASMEILSYLRQQGLEGEILHGQASYIAGRIGQLLQVAEARERLRGCRLGVVGQPSDWLISSHADSKLVLDRLGVELVDIPMQELTSLLASPQGHPLAEPSEEKDDAGLPPVTMYDAAKNEAIRRALPGAEAIYRALRTLVGRHALQGFTLRCFDLLTAVHNTGCLALARLNAEGIVAGCEGDVPTLLSMVVARALTGASSFQANPARIDPQTGEILLAHCTIPLDMVERYELDTHFESGIGVGIRGYVDAGPVTLFKLSGDLSRIFVEEGQLLCSQSQPDLCRTQLVVRLSHADRSAQLLAAPIGNHHVLLRGHHAAQLCALLGF